MHNTVTSLRDRGLLEHAIAMSRIVPPYYALEALLYHTELRVHPVGSPEVVWANRRAVGDRNDSDFMKRYKEITRHGK